MKKKGGGDVSGINRQAFYSSTLLARVISACIAGSPVQYTPSQLMQYLPSPYSRSQSTYIYRAPQCMSPRWNWDSPPLQPQASVPSPPDQRVGGHTRLRLKGWGSPNSNNWRNAQHSAYSVLQILPLPTLPYPTSKGRNIQLFPISFPLSFLSGNDSGISAISITSRFLFNALYFATSL